jgi:Transcriptional Coactivator p15 (PC4)
VRNWNGNVVVDFREFFVKDGKQLPTKKGSFLVHDLIQHCRLKKKCYFVYIYIYIYIYFFRGDFGDYCLHINAIKEITKYLVCIICGILFLLIALP